MVPKPQLTDHSNNLKIDSNLNCEPKRLELQYNGYLYDVTSFIQRHPGGRIIEMFLKTGEDSFNAVQQFHFRSMTKVSAIMESLPKRPITEAKGINSLIFSIHGKII